ncbi:AAA family ATPase [Lysinibacillus pakistanensis]|uniref:AAA family ATPase n=1 Tax=Lysinibacillus pakistanensis TaxID=759811 RepID=UPI003D2C8B5E
MNLTVNQAVWLAAAMMTYERFKNNEVKSIDDIALVQTDIRKRAQSLTDNNVDSARISQHFNADHQSNTQNYFRTMKENNRRLSYPGECEGVKERPDLNLQDSLFLSSGEEIKVDQLVSFIETEYRTFIENKQPALSSLEIDFEKIITHLNTYANHSYKNPIQLEDEEKQTYLDIRESGGEAVTELNKLAERLALKYGVKNKGKSKWLTGGNDVVRRYLWNQLKDGDYDHLLTSISIFAERKVDDVHFRIVVELDEKKAKQVDFDQHHKILTKPLIQDIAYCYYIRPDNGRDDEVSYELPEEVQKKVRDGEYKKVQLVYVLTHEQIQQKTLTNDQIYKKLDEAFENLLGYYNLVVGKVKHTKTDVEEASMYEKNIVLYGPPGTGKTYHTVIYAVAIIENISIEKLVSESYEEVLTRYIDYKKAGQIAFTTFHQSFGYEEFIEGIKPVLDNEESDQVKYKIEPGVFKHLCDHAQQLEISSTIPNQGFSTETRIWKVSLGRRGDDETKRDCFENNYIRIGWDDLGANITDETEFPNTSVKKIVSDFYYEMSIGDIVLSLGDQKHIDAIGFIIGEPEWLEQADYYKRSRKVEWIAKGIWENVYKFNQQTNLTLATVYELKKINREEINKLILRYAENKRDDFAIEENKKNYVFIIDEINRGNISKILGELITLIEPTKRLGAPEQMKVQLPYSKSEFGVPQNVYIIGTMNTADRSIALMDTALRRRFRFIEMMPNLRALEGINVGGIDIHKMVDTINRRIEVLFDREHTIGHAYFLGLKKEPTMANLGGIFENAIIPLLQEYFYEDYSKIQLILGDNAKANNLKFILDTPVLMDKIFKASPDVDLPESKYCIQRAAFHDQQSYIGIYE